MAYRRQFRTNKNISSAHKPYHIFNPHSNPSPILRNNNIIIVSIDPGIVNCGVYIGYYDTISKKTSSLYMARLCFNKSTNHYVESMKQLKELEEKNNYFSSAHFILIESQMSISYNNTRMGQHLLTLLSTIVKDKGNRPLVLEYNSQIKTKLLGCPKKMKKPDYKKWCKRKAQELLEQNKDQDHEKEFIVNLNIGKGDDMGDAVCQFFTWIKIMEDDNYFVPQILRVI